MSLRCTPGAAEWEERAGITTLSCVGRQWKNLMEFHVNGKKYFAGGNSVWIVAMMGVECKCFVAFLSELYYFCPVTERLLKMATYGRRNERTEAPR
jgi:hypothetical protein